MITLGEKIRALRESQEISQRKLAKLADISNDYISKIELGKIENIGIVTLQKIAMALNVDSLFLQDTVAEILPKKKSLYSLKKDTPSFVKESKKSYSAKPQKTDKYIEKIIKIWPTLSEQDKEVVLKMIQQLSKK